MIKRAGCGAFLSMLRSQFEVGIWAPTGEALLQEVAKFLASGTSLKWCFLWGREAGAPIRDLRQLFKMISDPDHGPGRVLQIHWDDTATIASPKSNVFHIVKWDLVAPNDTYFKKITGPFDALSRNPSDIEYDLRNLKKTMNERSNSLPSTTERAKKPMDGSLARGSKEKVFGVDVDKKVEENVLAHGMIVSLAGSTLHGRLIEEGNVSIMISSVVPVSEEVLLYEGNNNNDPPVVCLGQAMKSITKWTIEALAPTSEGKKA